MNAIDVGIILDYLKTLPDKHPATYGRAYSAALRVRLRGGSLDNLTDEARALKSRVAELEAKIKDSANSERYWREIEEAKRERQYYSDLRADEDKNNS